MRGLCQRAILIALAFVLGGCASIVSDDDSTTYLQTDPEEARCELHGQDLKRVVHTPNSLTLPAAAAPITVACKAEGFKTTSATLDTKMDGWILGNIIFGGIVGVVIDAARGAGQKYPPQMMVVLEPEIFPTAAARDEWYDKQKDIALQKWSRVRADIESLCRDTQDQFQCDERMNRMRTEREKELADLERRRANARYGTAAAVSPSM